MLKSLLTAVVVGVSVIAGPAAAVLADSTATAAVQCPPDTHWSDKLQMCVDDTHW
ncbi:hypothetical protein AB0A63_40450 [Lentzea sp. NPDC042327]|uniref:hypothetical protein n=1 Tax=Lentzea sp. NPDC042327 TaxID=3154801 RepID=UPI00340CF0FA